VSIGEKVFPAFEALFNPQLKVKKPWIFRLFCGRISQEAI